MLKRCGGIIRGVLTSDQVHEHYTQDLIGSLSGEKTEPSPIFQQVRPVTKYITPDIGDAARNQRGYPHNIYHFNMDERGSFSTMYVKFASEFVRESLGKARLKQLQNVYIYPEKTFSDKEFIYEDFVIGEFVYSVPGSQIHESLKVEENDEQGNYKLGPVFGRSGTLYDTTPYQSSEMIKAIEVISKNDYYSKKSTIIRPVQEFKCLDFVVVDRSESKTKVSLFQISKNKTKQISLI